MIQFPRSSVSAVSFSRVTTRFFLLGLVAFVLVAGAARLPAVDLYWDTTAGAGNGVGGSGTYGSTFSASSSGSASLQTPAVSDNLFFQGTAGTITVGINPTAASFTFNTDGYKITGNSATARTLTGPITLAANVGLTIGNGETSAITIGIGSLSGSTGSSLIVNGSATTTNVTRLNLATNNAIVSVPITITGAGFANIAATAQATTVSGAVTGSGTRLTLGATSNNAITFSSAINNGSGDVRIAASAAGGAGVVTLSGSGNTWGTTELNNSSTGILRMGVANALPTATTLTFGVSSGNGQSIVELSGFNTTIGQLTNGAQAGGTLRNTSASAAILTISGSDAAAAAYSGTLTDGVGGGALSLVRSGSGTTILSAANSYTGGTIVSGGTLTVAASTGSLASTSSLQVDGGTLNLNNTAGQTVAALSGSGGTIALASLVNLNANQSTNTSFSGVLSSAGSLTKSNSGTLTLSAANTYTGGTTVSAGTLAISSTGTFGDAAGAITVSGGTLDLGTLSRTRTGTIALTGGTISNGTLEKTGGSFDAQSGIASAVLAGTAGLTKSTAGTVTLSATNTYSGTTTLSAGTLEIHNASAIGTGTFTITGGTFSNSSGGAFTLSTNNAQNWNGDFTFGGTNALGLGTGAVTLGGNRQVTINNDLVVGGAIGDSGSGFSLTKAGAGTLQLSANSTYSGGTTVSAGTLTVDSEKNTALGSGAVTVSSGATLIIDRVSMSNGLTLNGGTLAGTNGFGETWSGTIALAATSTINSSFSMLANNTISGTGGLNKAGAGALTLSGTNTYSGATAVNEGSLVVNGSTHTSSAFTIASGGTLAGSGTIGGATTIQSGGILAPGNSPGIMTFSNGLTLDSGSITNFEINGLTRGTDHDGINITSGLLTYGGTFNLSFGDTIANGNSLSLFQQSGSGNTGSFSSIAATGSYVGSFVNDSGVWSLTSGAQVLSFSQSTGNLSVSAIPEPSTYAAIFGALALVGVIAHRRRQKRAA